MKVVIVDHRVSVEETINLKRLNYEVLFCPPSTALYDAVSGHPDMLLHPLEDKKIVVHRDMIPAFSGTLCKLGLEVHYSDNRLQSSYPYDILLNGLSLGNFYVHNTPYTDPVLRKLINHKKLLHVKQGYTKCSTTVVNENAVITNDTGIAKTLCNEQVDVLLLPYGDIELPGLNYGFIGGSSGLLEERCLAFFGSLDEYTYGREVYAFLKKHRVEPVFLSKGKLIDRGTLFRI